MAREYVDVEAKGGRDAGKVYRITEMSAEAGEWFAYRVIGSLVDADKDHKLAALWEMFGKAGNLEVLSQADIGTIMTLLMQADQSRMKSLLDEMKACWKMKCDGDFIRNLADGDIEEISTLMMLRMKTLELHINFFMTGVQSLTG
ncbi:MAG: hypothetical protein NC112_09035 [Oxalobacter formigenes]|nr:hypothetical protein [Oxalobacter formigenes]